MEYDNDYRPVRVEASNSDPDYFIRSHTRLSMVNDEVKVVWAIPDRLMRNEGLLMMILDELVDEFRERSK